MQIWGLLSKWIWTSRLRRRRMPKFKRAPLLTPSISSRCWSRPSSGVKRRHPCRPRIKLPTLFLRHQSLPQQRRLPVCKRRCWARHDSIGPSSAILETNGRNCRKVASTATWRKSRTAARKRTNRYRALIRLSRVNSLLVTHRPRPSIIAPYTDLPHWSARYKVHLFPAAAAASSSRRTKTAMEAVRVHLKRRYSNLPWACRWSGSNGGHLWDPSRLSARRWALRRLLVPFAIITHRQQQQQQPLSFRTRWLPKKSLHYHLPRRWFRLRATWSIRPSSSRARIVCRRRMWRCIHLPALVPRLSRRPAPNFFLRPPAACRTHLRWTPPVQPVRAPASNSTASTSGWKRVGPSTSHLTLDNCFSAQLKYNCVYVFVMFFLPFHSQFVFFWFSCWLNPSAGNLLVWITQ